jgi:hypothetical protein
MRQSSCFLWNCVLQPTLAMLLLAGCAAPLADTRRQAHASNSAAEADASRRNEFTPRDCPPISDEAVIVARVSRSNSGAPRTQHPGVDLQVSDGDAAFVIRVHFGDLGDGRNSILPFNECKNMEPLPVVYPVETQRVKALLNYLGRRNYCVGKFTSWGIPWWPSPARGSICGDAFRQTVQRLGIAPAVLHDMRHWIRASGAGKWAFDRGQRQPVDEFFRTDGS